jgi:hypothetical protein
LDEQAVGDEDLAVWRKDGAGSLATASRQISTRSTPMSSSAQPVTAMVPATAALFSGVSNAPNGATVSCRTKKTTGTVTVTFGD